MTEACRFATLACRREEHSLLHVSKGPSGEGEREGHTWAKTIFTLPNKTVQMLKCSGLSNSFVAMSHLQELSASMGPSRSDNEVSELCFHSLNYRRPDYAK